MLNEERRIAAEDQARAEALNSALVGLAIINAASQPKVTFPPAPNSGGHYCYNYGSYSYCP